MKPPVVPSTIAGTDPAWTPRAPDLRFDIFKGRLCEPVEKFSTNQRRTGRPRKGAEPVATPIEWADQLKVLR
jgi:hypothetical protein